MSWYARLSIAIVFVAFGHICLAAEHEQLIVVVTDDWSATRGVMSTFDLHDHEWRLRTDSIDVSIGKNGSAWGLGLHPQQNGSQKREGDGRSPAGMFEIGPAFGYSSTVATGLTYRAMTRFDYCIDVDGSPQYNQIVDSREVAPDLIARSTEPMRRDIHINGDERYALGFVIEHNVNAERSGGSCIFAHLWQTPGQTTAGCTAMDTATMKQLLEWLDDERRPLFVLLPRAQYERVRDEWRLPKLTAQR